MISRRCCFVGQHARQQAREAWLLGKTSARAPKSAGFIGVRVPAYSGERGSLRARALLSMLPVVWTSTLSLWLSTVGPLKPNVASGASHGSRDAASVANSVGWHLGA